MNIARIRYHEAGLLDALLPKLRWRVFHVSRLSSLDAILAAGEIRPNRDGRFSSPFGSTNGFFRNRGCVSLFDYRSLADDALSDSVMKCSPTQFAHDSDFAIFFLSPSAYRALVSSERWHSERAFQEQIVPRLEAGYEGPIPLTLVEEVLCVEVERDPDSLSRRLLDARRRWQVSKG